MAYQQMCIERNIYALRLNHHNLSAKLLPFGVSCKIRVGLLNENLFSKPAVTIERATEYAPFL